jgi:rubredoxin
VFSNNIQIIMSENFKQYICVVCGLIYDEAEGWPDDGIDAGTKWEDVPDTWTCPDCGVTKDDFELLEE